MKRRLMIARALINKPYLLILDEATVGLDPQTRHLVWQKLRSLKEQGVTMLLCTQNMDEAWRLCDRIAIMNEGKIVALGAPRELVAQYGGSEILGARPDPVSRGPVLGKLRERGFQFQEIEDTLYIFHSDGQALDEDLRQELKIVSQHVPTLEDGLPEADGKDLAGMNTALCPASRSLLSS